MKLTSLTTLKSASLVALALSATALAAPAQASTFTRTSPTTGGQIAPGISEVGGIVLDLIGTNGTRITSQLSASSLFEGYASGNPLTIGTQTGFTSSLLSSLGGGLQQAAVRLTLWDGDSAAGNFDYNDNTLQLNGISFGNFSSVITQNTDGSGNVASAGLSSGGFRNDTLDTGWFLNTNASSLSSLFTSLMNTGSVVYRLSDVDPGENYLDFKRGLAGSSVNVALGPTITPSQAVPEPASLIGILGLGAFGITTLRKRKQLAQVKA